MTARARKEVCCCEKVLPKFLSAADLPVPVRADRGAHALFLQRLQVAPHLARLHDKMVRRAARRCGYSALALRHPARRGHRRGSGDAARHGRGHRQHAPPHAHRLPHGQQHPDVLLGYHHGRNVHAAVRGHRSGQGLSDAHSGARDVLHALRHPQRHAQAAPARQERL